MSETIADALAHALVEHAARPALVADARTVHYRELAALVDGARRQLRGLGVAPGQVVPLFARRTPEAIAVALAALFEGAAFAWCSPKSRTPQLARAVEALAPAGLIVDDWGLAVAGGAETELRTIRLAVDGALTRSGAAGPISAPAGGAACLLFTSGSSGPPKAVRVGATDLLARARGEMAAFALRPDDALLGVLPFSFDVGLNQLLSALVTGAALHLGDAWLRLDLERALARGRITGIAAVPSLWAAALNGAARDRPLFDGAGALRFVTVSGGSLRREELAALCRGLGARVKIHKTYGQTETFRSTLLADAGPLERTDSVGRALDGVQVLIAADRERRCAPGEEGEVVHVGCGTMLGYLGDEAATRAKLGTHAALPGATVVYTGDRGLVDGDGFLYLRGRGDAMIKSGGFRFYPHELEEVLARHPAVVEAVAFGVPDPLLGERAAAVAVLRAAAPDLRRFAAASLPGYMVPSGIAVWPELPRTASGKPARHEIREAYLASLSDPAQAD